MIQEVRIYKKFDIDLIALCAAGFPVTEMIRTAVTAFANGESVKFDIGPAQFFDLNDKHSVRMRISITDKNAIRVLKNIKHGHRNSFCKNVLRSAVSNLAAYFADSSMLGLCQPATSSIMKADPVLAKLQPFNDMTVPAQTVYEPPVQAAAQEVKAPVPLQVATVPICQPEPKPPVQMPVQIPAPPQTDASTNTNTSSDVDEDSILDMFDGL